MDGRSEQDTAPDADDFTEAEAHMRRYGPSEEPAEAEAHGYRHGASEEPAEAEAHMPYKYRGPEATESAEEPAEAEAHGIGSPLGDDASARRDPEGRR